MRPRRYYKSKHVYLATSRLRKSLPLVPDRLINSVLKGILARAQHLYPITLCDALIMGNHFHFIFICYDPQVVADYFCYIKGEIATAINKLTGRRGNVWHGRTDTPMLATVDSIIEKTIYLYTNPQSENLIDKIEQYPGINSWEALVSGKNLEEECIWYPSRDLKRIPKVAEEHKLRDRLLEALGDTDEEGRPREKHILNICPLAWVKYFSEITEDEAREKIISGVRALESEYRIVRSYPPMGKKRLRTASIYRWHLPKKYGRRVFIVCSDIEYRKVLIKEYRDFVKKCRNIYRRWMSGDFSEFFPPGAFPPPACRIASAV